MTKPKYATPTYRKTRAHYTHLQQTGQWLTCQETTCLHPTRDIAPNQPIDIAHDPTGTHILGPAHQHCNRHEGATRGHQQRQGHGRWNL